MFPRATNEQWKIFYSIQWYIDDRELQSFNERDWSALFKARFSNEKMLGLQGSPSLPWSIFLAYCIDALRDLPKSNLLFGASDKKNNDYADSSTKVCPFETAASVLAKIGATQPRGFLN
jgi:hypothetical protein